MPSAHATPRKRAAGRSSPWRTCLVVLLGGGLLFVWLRYTTLSDVTGHSHFRAVSALRTQQEKLGSIAAAGGSQSLGRTSGGESVGMSTALGDTLHLASGATPTPMINAIERQHELHVTVRRQQHLTPLLPAEPAVDAPATCHARAHTELEGGVVKWGTDNRVQSAAACCASCSAHAERARVESHQKPCNIWVHCGDSELCGDKLGQCWLKHALDPSEPPSRGSGPKVPWTSGAVLPMPVESYRVASRTKRALRQQQALTMLEGVELVVGLRNETGTLELLTPRHTQHPHFSYPLPLEDVDIRLGNHGEHLDRVSSAQAVAVAVAVAVALVPALGEHLDRMMMRGRRATAPSRVRPHTRGHHVATLARTPHARLTRPRVLWLPARVAQRPDLFHHLGDVTLRATPRGGREVLCSTVASGQVAAAAAASASSHTVGGGTLHRGGGEAPEGSGPLWTHTTLTGIQALNGRRRTGACPLGVTRRVVAHRASADGGGGGIDLIFDVSNPSAETAVSLDALGLSMPFDQDFVGRTLPQVAHQCSFVEPYLGLGGGYVQVTRATGGGPVLLLLPLPGTEFEAWRPLRNGEDSMRLDFMFEQSYEVRTHRSRTARELAGSHGRVVG